MAIEMNGKHFLNELEIFEATGEKIINIKLLLNSPKTIPPTFVEWERADTTERFQYWTSVS